MFGKTQKRLRELEREVKDLRAALDKRTTFDTFEYGKVDTEWVARMVARHIKEAAGKGGGNGEEVTF